MSPVLDGRTRLIVDSLRQSFDDLVSIYQFGSSADGTAGPSSDADIAVLTTATS